MKKIILLASIMIISLCSFAGAPPEAVQKAFAKKFPAATDIKWGKENATDYEADFKINGIKYSANFSADGTWLETETEIPVSQLPNAVSDAIKKKYPGWEIVSGDQIESAKQGVLFEADIKSGLKKKEVLYKNDGTFVK